MITAHIDKISDMSLNERFGVVTKVVRKAVVIGIQNETDFGILLTALGDDQQPIIPQPGSSLSGTMLVLTERNPTLVDNEKVEVELVYELPFSEGQDLDNPTPHGGVVFGEMKCNMQQVETNQDGSGELISVSHTYEDDDPDYANQTKVQVGQIQVQASQKTLSFQGIKTTQAPWALAAALVSHVNTVPIWGADARYWLCTAVTWKLCDASNPQAMRYYMTFEFQFNEDSWDPVAVFIDERTGRPPKGLVEGTGYKVIQYQPDVDIEQVLGVPYQGGA